MIEGCNHMINGYCGQCHKGFILSSDLTTCTSDCTTKNCKYCAEGPCTRCMAGYTLTTTNGTTICQKNPCNITNCNLCDINGTCVKCNSYMTMNGTQCINTCNITECLYCKAKNSICFECVAGKSYNYWN